MEDFVLAISATCSLQHRNWIEDNMTFAKIEPSRNAGDLFLRFDLTPFRASNETIDSVIEQAQGFLKKNGFKLNKLKNLDKNSRFNFDLGILVRPNEYSKSCKLPSEFISLLTRKGFSIGVSAYLTNSRSRKSAAKRR